MPETSTSSPRLSPQPQQLLDAEQHQARTDETHIDAREHLSTVDPSQPSISPPFQPLFTLVTDTSTRQTHHPRVQYIFSDDDPEILSEALGQHSRYQHEIQQRQLLIQQQEQEHRQHRSSSSSSRENVRASTNASASGSSTSNRIQRPSPPPMPTAPPRTIVLDLVPRPSASPSSTTQPESHPAGAASYDVAWASSLSSDWAVTSATIEPMSSADGTASRPAVHTSSTESDDGGAPAPRLMLRVEGMGIPPPPSAIAIGPRKQAALATGAKKRPSQESMSNSGASGGPGLGTQDYNTIVEEFDKRMGVLRKVVDAGMERQIKMAAAEAEVSAGAGDGNGEDNTRSPFAQDTVAQPALATATSASDQAGVDQEQLYGQTSSTEDSAQPSVQQQEEPSLQS